MLDALILATVLCGFLGIVLKRNLMMKVFSMDVMSTGVIAYYVLVAAKGGLFTPILSLLPEGSEPGLAENIDQAIAYADPVPQAVILTAIVIGFSIQALMLVGVMKLSQDYPSLDTRDIEEGNMS
ncbi:MAG: cation:proton antiporter subunit C [Merismopedia sp. SIO2A8]|nr:cation:proton antiporter subunit C [Symploca sp. SIO2B6]NET51901.1 cation:proton antiporter subunit C [Merismopedia sp. SIO2A8]